MRTTQYSLVYGIMEIITQIKEKHGQIIQNLVYQWKSHCVKGTDHF